jgi:hypothetical protein
MRRRSLHIGGDRGHPEPKVAPVEEEETFDPEAAKTDDNPFPEDLVTEEEVIDTPSDDYDSMTVEQLKALCRAANLPVSGTKAELIERLRTLEEVPVEETAAEESVEDVPAEAAASDDPVEGDVSESRGNEKQPTDSE